MESPVLTVRFSKLFKRAQYYTVLMALQLQELVKKDVVENDMSGKVSVVKRKDATSRRYICGW